MVTNIILWAKKKKKKMRTVVLLWYQLCSTDLFSPKIPSCFQFWTSKTYIPTKSRSSYLSLAWARQHSSSQRKPLAWARYAEVNISLKRAKYFKLKKGSRLGENGGKGGSPLHELSLKRESARLSENGGCGFGLGENALVLSEVNIILSLFSLFLTFSFTLLEFSLIFPEKHTK